MNKYFIFALIALLIIVYKVGGDDSAPIKVALVNEISDKGSSMKLAKSLKVSTKGTGSTNESSPLEGIGPNDTEVSAHIISEEDFLEKEHVIVLDEYVNSSYVIDDVTEPPKDYAKDIPLEMLSVNEVKVEDMVEYSQNISLESMTETIDEINYGDMFPTENSVLLDDMIDYNVEINTIKASG